MVPKKEEYPDWVVLSPSTQGLELHPTAARAKAAAIRRFMGVAPFVKGLHPRSAPEAKKVGTIDFVPTF